MFLNGLTLTVAGMIVVFVFLALLVLIMKLLYFLVKKFAPNSLIEKAGEAKDAKVSAMAPQPQIDTTAEIAAAIAAIRAYITARG